MPIGLPNRNLTLAMKLIFIELFNMLDRIDVEQTQTQ